MVTIMEGSHWLVEHLQELLETENGRNLFETTVIYLFSNLKNDKQKVTAKLRQISNKGGDIADTIAQKLRKEGKILGLEEGIRQVAFTMIKEGFDNDTIARCTNMNIRQIDLLRDLDDLNTDI